MYTITQAFSHESRDRTKGVAWA